jgi:hypothetical protein
MTEPRTERGGLDEIPALVVVGNDLTQSDKWRCRSGRGRTSMPIGTRLVVM